MILKIFYNNISYNFFQNEKVRISLYIILFLLIFFYSFELLNKLYNLFLVYNHQGISLMLFHIKFDNAEKE